jgi:hypothetical protein
VSARACVCLAAVSALALATGACTSASGPAGPEAQSYENTIRWSTASEVDNFGYDVYRAESEDGPWQRLTSEVVEGAGTTDEPSYYRFVDDSIDPHRTYYYYVESISMSGQRKRFTPVGEAAAKIPPGETSPAPR